MKASIDITLIFLFFMIDGIGAIVVFVSNQGYRILYLKTWISGVFDFCCLSFFITGNECQFYTEVEDNSQSGYSIQTTQTWTGKR